MAKLDVITKLDAVVKAASQNQRKGSSGSESNKSTT